MGIIRQACTAGGACETQYLVVARHGESEANLQLSTSADGLYYSLSGSDPAVPLTVRGVAQAKELAKRVASLFPGERPLARIYHTRFRRVELTAEAVAAALDYPLARLEDARLNKRNYGQFWNLTRQGVRLLHPHEWERYLSEGDLEYRSPGGENYKDVFARVDDFIEKEVQQLCGNALVVTHLLPALCFRRRLEALSDQEVLRHYEEMLLPNAHILVYEKCGNTWRLCREYTNLAPESRPMAG